VFARIVGGGKKEDSAKRKKDYSRSRCTGRVGKQLPPNLVRKRSKKVLQRCRKKVEGTKPAGHPFDTGNGVDFSKNKEQKRGLGDTSTEEDVPIALK